MSDRNGKRRNTEPALPFDCQSNTTVVQKHSRQNTVISIFLFFDLRQQTMTGTCQMSNSVWTVS